MKNAKNKTLPSESPGASCDPTGFAAIEKMRERLENLKECFRVSGLINSSLQLDQVLENIMTTSRSILKADACSLMLVDEKKDELVFEVAQGPAADKLKGGLRIGRGQGIAGHVYATGEPLLIEDAYPTRDSTRNSTASPDTARKRSYACRSRSRKES